jgi:hypothetical protein
MKRIWRGRVRDRVWKAFVALAGQLVSTGELVRRTWPRKRRFHTGEYRRVRAAAAIGLATFTAAAIRKIQAGSCGNRGRNMTAT